MASHPPSENVAAGHRFRLLLPRRPGARLREVRSLWLPEVIVLLGLAVVAAIAFSGPRLDLAAIRPFYHPGLANPWPTGEEPFWRAWYKSTPWITASLGAAGLSVLLAGFIVPAKAHLRMHGLFILLAVALGPGLVINAGLKDHWGRPRPRDVRELGGRAEYSVPLVPSHAGGKSFACGHCSVGFLYALGWWVWRRRSRRLALGSLGLGVAVGGMLVVDRMAAGGHFLSDGIWAALIGWAVAHALYYYVLQVPLREPAAPGAGAIPKPALPWAVRLRVAAVLGVVALAVIAVAILSWRYVDLTARVALPSAPTRCAIEIVADRLDVDLHLTNAPGDALECSGDIHGFRLSPDEITARWHVERHGGDAVVRYLVHEHGRYLYLDSAASLRLPWRAVRSITVRVGKGNISLIDDTGGTLSHAMRPATDLRTGSGIVRDLPR